MLYVGVLLLIVILGSPQKLATAYGLAVTGTLLLTTLLFLALGHWVWGWPMPVLVLIAIGIGGMEIVFLAANLTKIAFGGRVPLLIAAAALFVMTWRRGYAETTQLRIDREGSMADFVGAL